MTLRTQKKADGLQIIILGMPSIILESTIHFKPLYFIIFAN